MSRHPTAWLAAALAMIPATAGALDCMRPNAGEEFNEIAAAGGAPQVVVGTLTRESPPRRKGRANVWIGYDLKGVRLLGTGKGARHIGGVTVRSNCLGRNCGRLVRSGTYGLFLLRPRKGSRPLIVTGPCGGGLYPGPTPAVSALLAKCLRAGQCSTAVIGELGRP